MAKGLKFFYEFSTERGEDFGKLHKVEILVEGYSGSATQLLASNNPFNFYSNKDISENYLGGLTPTNYSLEAIKTAIFNTSSFTNEKYGDIVFKYYIDSVLQTTGVISPFEGYDMDLPNGISVTTLGAECGLVSLKNSTYNVQGERGKLIVIIDNILKTIPENTFGIEVIDNTKCYDIDGLLKGLYFDQEIDDTNFLGLSNYEVLKQILKEYHQLVFSNGLWSIRNIAEISGGDSVRKVYVNAVQTISANYTRPTIDVQRLTGGSFGKMFSQQNITVVKSKSNLRNVFADSEFTSQGGWTYNGLAGALFNIENGLLKNNGNSTFTDSNLATNFDYVQSSGVPFYPYRGIYQQGETLEGLKIKLKASKGAGIKNLRLQIYAIGGNTVAGSYLNSDNTWYTREGFTSGTPIYELSYSDGQETVIDIPTPPYFDPQYIPGVENLYPIGYFNNLLPNQEVPPSDIPYTLYIRVFLPERNTYDNVTSLNTDVNIDYIRVERSNENSVLVEGYEKNFGVDIQADRKSNLTVNVGIGENTYPLGLDALFASDGQPIVKYARYGSTALFSIDEYISRAYLSVLSNRLTYYEGSVLGKVSFTDLIAIDSSKYRVHNLNFNSRTNTSTIKIVELFSSISTGIIVEEENTSVNNSELYKKIYDDVIKNFDTYKLTFNDPNIQKTIGTNGQSLISLKPDVRHNTIQAKEVYLKATGDGIITDVAQSTTSDFTLIKPAKNGTYALISDIEEQAWLLTANVLSVKGFLGSLNNFDVGFKRNNVEYLTLDTNGITSLKDITSSGNLTLQKGNPRLRLRDTGAGSHTGGFDLHVNGDEFLIDDNTHSKNILRNYLNSTVHTTDFDAEVYNFKNGLTTYARMASTGFNLPYLTPSQLVATDASDNLVSLSTATYPSLAELAFTKGLTSNAQTQINAKFTLPSLTSGSVLFSNGTTISESNAQLFWDNTNSRLGVGTSNPTLAKLQVNGAIYQQGADGLGVGIYTNGALRFLSNQNFIDFNNGGAANNVSFRNGSGVRTDFFISATGNVGIGTTSPSAKLHTYTTTANGALIESNLNTGTSLFQLKSSLGNLFTQYNNGYLQLGGTTGSAITVETNGNVGFGVTPTGKLDVGGNVRISSSNPMRYEFNKSGAFYNWIESDGVVGNNFMRFAVANTEYLRILTNGNVGIGTTSPLFKLDVNGTGHFTGSVLFDAIASCPISPTLGSHLTNKAYVDSLSFIKKGENVLTISLTNITLSGTQTVNGVALVAGNLILVAGQTTGSQNGVYTVASGAWTRSTLNDIDAEIRGAYHLITNGTYANQRFINTNTSTITVGTTAITYALDFGAETDPIFVNFRETSRGANLVYASGNGTSAGIGTWRGLVPADIPTLNQNTTGNALTATILQTTRNIAATGDIAWNVNFNGSTDVTASATLATVNANVGTFAGLTVNAKGLVTGATALTTIASYGITDYNSLWDTRLGTKTTTNLAEGTNLYYTQARFDSAFGAKTTSNLTEGTNLYYTQARFDTAFSNKFLSNFSADNTITGSATNYIDFANGFIQNFEIYSPNLDATFSGVVVDQIATGSSSGTIGQFLHKNKTTNALEWYSIVKSDVGLGNVENTALSTWTGSTNITTLGTIGTGTWNGTTIAINKGGTGLTSLGTANQLLRVNATATALEYFTPTYISGNQNITLSGVVTGSGTTSITTSIANGAITNAMLANSAVASLSGTNTGDNAPNSLYSGLVSNATHTGDATGATALTVVGLRGVALPTLGASAGLLRYTGTGTNTWVFDTNTYLTGNQSISITGDATGTGATSIALTLANSGVTAGTYRSVTVDAKGRVTAGTNPTTISGYGITDFYSQVVSGFVTGTNSTVLNTDSLEVALEKLQGQVNARLTANQTITLTGDVTGSGATGITTSISNATVTGKLLTGYLSGAGVVSATDSILGAIQKLNGNIGAISLTSLGGQAQLNGTGFVKANGTTITYDNSTYLTTSSASSTYLTQANATANYQPLDADLTSIAGLTGTTGLLRKTAANTWALDTASYQTALSGTGFMSSVGTTISYSKNINLENTTFANQNGIIRKNGVLFLHDFSYYGEADNTFLGKNAGNLLMGNYFDTPVDAGRNTSIGSNSFSLNIQGYDNSALGFKSLNKNDYGFENTAIGGYSLENNIGGSLNIALGFKALNKNTNGVANIGIGHGSLFTNTTGNNNTAIGRNAMYFNTTGFQNAALGQQALYYNTTGLQNTAIGFSALNNNTTGSYNTALGSLSLAVNTTGNYNTSLGHNSLRFNTTGIQNTAVGVFSLVSTTTGSYNVGLGYYSGSGLTTGSNNVFIGNNAGGGVTTGSNNIVIGSNTNGLASNLTDTIIIGSVGGFRRLVIDSLGNAGLGIDNPLHKLHVNGDIRATTNLTVDGNASFGVTNPLTITQKDYVQGSITSNYNEISSYGKWLRLNTDSGFSLRHNEVDAISFTEGNWKFNTNFSIVSGEEVNDWTGFNVDDRFRIGINENIGLATVEMVYENSIIRNYWDSDGIFTHVDNSGNSRKYLREGDIVGGGSSSIPNLQQVTAEGANSSIKMQFNGVNYATLSDLGTSQGLDSVLGNNNTANDKNIFLNGLSSAYTLGYGGTSKFYINHSSAGVLNMVQTAGTDFNINASNNLNILASQAIGINATGNIGIGTNAQIALQSTTGSFFATGALSLQSGTGDLDLIANSGMLNIGWNNPTFNKTRIGRSNTNDYIFMNGQKYNFVLPTVSSGDYLVMQINGTDVTVKKATIFASGGKNYLTV